MKSPEPYWYLASYPKSGNTWCRVFISELRRLAGLDQASKTAVTPEQGWELQLNRDLTTGTIMSSRFSLDDQLGIDSSDRRWTEQRQIPVLLLRDEDLLEKPRRAFQCLAECLTLPAEGEWMARAVDTTNVEKLRARKEGEGGFCETPRGCERLFRSGRRGEGFKRLSDGQLARLSRVSQPHWKTLGTPILNPARLTVRRP